ncbi:MAG: hypothetical protein PVSMB2_00460 [Ktedonobacteraceae bacterium]
MNIHIRYFASLRETVERTEETIAIDEDTRVADVRLLLATRYPRLQSLLERSVCAVNRGYVSPETVLHENDELVFIPPMGGGTAMEPIVQLTREPLNRDALVVATSDPSVGGIVVFEGVVRDNARGKQVRYLEYETYEEMAEQQIRTIIGEAQQRWSVERFAVANR